MIIVRAQILTAVVALALIAMIQMDGLIRGLHILAVMKIKDAPVKIKSIKIILVQGYPVIIQ